jgi:hypothetical protein
VKSESVAPPRGDSPLPALPADTSAANEGAAHNAVESKAGRMIEVASFFIEGLSQKQSARSRTQSKNLVEIVFGKK